MTLVEFRVATVEIIAVGGPEEDVARKEMARIVTEPWECLKKT